jgi:protein-disulfide isomerase
MTNSPVRSSSGSALERAANVVLALSALAIAIVVVSRGFREPIATEAAESRPTFVEDWKSLLKHASIRGQPGAAVTVVEFIDFQCPFCRLYQKTLEELTQANSGTVALAFMHYPLPPHPFARAAALASECSGAQGRFWEFTTAALAAQDSLPSSPWRQLAKRSGVADGRAFDECMRSEQFMARVDSGAAVASRVGVRGTPGIMVNGWLYTRPPSDSTLRRVVAELTAGVDPKKVFSQ